MTNAPDRKNPLVANIVLLVLFLVLVGVGVVTVMVPELADAPTGENDSGAETPATP